MESRHWWWCRRRIAVMLIGGAWDGGGSHRFELNQQLTAAERRTYFFNISNNAVIGLQNCAASDWFIHRTRPQSADGVITARLREYL